MLKEGYTVLYGEGVEIRKENNEADAHEFSISEQMGMRAGWRGLDWGFVVVTAVALLAVWPFLSRASLPMQTDAELHIFRLHELTLLIQGGEWYPRWAPNFYHGYGYPIFNYYAPLTYYLGLLVSLWARFDAVAGVKAVFVLGLLLAAIGIYGFVRDNWGRRAGYVAAAVFVYAPYVQYVDPHARGVLAESFSFGAFAVALWALDRLRRSGSMGAWGTAVLSVAAVIVSHNLMGLLFFGILFAWAVWQLLFGRGAGLENGRFRNGRNQNGRWLPLLPLLALLLGLGTAAFFWLPVILERNAVNLTTLIGAGDNYDFRTHFLSLRELFAPSQRLDWGATEPAFRLNIGVAQWLLGSVGAALLLARRVRHGAHVRFFLLSGGVLLFLMLPAALPVWETLPFLPYFQFPWRLLGPLAAMLAVLAGAGVGALTGAEGLLPPRWRLGGTAVFLLLPLILALPLSQPAPWPDFGEVNKLRMSLIEHQGRWLGTTSTADFVPATVDVTPERNGNVVAGIYDGEPLDRVNRVMLPEGATVTAEEIRPLHTRYQVTSPRPTRLRLFLFQFPGWQVTIDGEPVATELGRPEGFIVIPLPEGEHVVDVWFGSTPARTLATAVTWLSLGLMLVGAVWRRRSRRTEIRAALPPAARGDGVLLATVLFFMLVHVLLLEPSGWLRYQSVNFVAEPADVQQFVNFGDQMALIGYDTNGERPLASGDLMQLTLYWQAQTELAINYQVFVHLLRPDGTLVTQSNKLNPGDFPTRRWPLDKYVRDEHYLQLPADLPAGAYTVAVGVWVQNEGWRLPVFDGSGAQVGDSAPLFVVHVGGER